MIAGEVLRSRRLPLGVGVGVSLREGQRVAHGRVDTDAEEVADAAYVTVGREDLLQKAVLSQSLWLQLGCDPFSLPRSR